MQQSAYTIKNPIGIGVMTALSVVSLASNTAQFSHANLTSSQNQTFVYESVSFFGDYGGELCASSQLSKEVRGDVMISQKDFKRYANHEKITAQLQILEVRKHISQFEFDEDYEEM